MKLFLSVADAAWVLGVTPQTVRVMIRRGIIAVDGQTVGGIRLLDPEAVERLARARASRSAQSVPGRDGRHSPDPVSSQHSPRSSASLASTPPAITSNSDGETP